jgi:MYXO-CTERM domain-containing protein
LAQIGSPGTKTWEQGDFNGNGTVAITTDILPALAQIGLPALPVQGVAAAAPAISAIPEPASAGLALVGLLAAGAFRKRHV